MYLRWLYRILAALLAFELTYQWLAPRHGMWLTALGVFVMVYLVDSYVSRKVR